MNDFKIRIYEEFASGAAQRYILGNYVKIALEFQAMLLNLVNTNFNVCLVNENACF